MVKLSSVNFCSCLALIDTYLLYTSIPSLYHQSAKVISSCWNWIVPRTQWIRPYYLPFIDCKNNTYVVQSTEHVRGIGSHTLRLPILAPDGLPK